LKTSLNSTFDNSVIELFEDKFEFNFWQFCNRVSWWKRLIV